MWRTIFTLSVASAALYLAIQESALIRSWVDELDPQEQVTAISDGLKHNVDNRLSQFQQEVITPLSERQGEQIAALQADIEALKAQLAKASAAPSAVTTPAPVMEAAPIREVETALTSAAETVTEVAYMSDDERRQALQQLSQKMALKSIQAGQ